MYVFGDLLKLKATAFEVFFSNDCIIVLSKCKDFLKIHFIFKVLGFFNAT